MSLGGGGGGGSPAPVVQQTTQPKATTPQPVNTAFLGGQGVSTPSTQTAQPLDFLRQALATSPMAQAPSGEAYLQGAKKKDERMFEFMGGTRQPSTGQQPGMMVDRRADLRSMVSADPGTQIPSAEGLPPATYAVAPQNFAGNPPGGEGFGRRALMGSEGQVVTQALPADTVQQTETPVVAPSGDVVPVGTPPTPNQAVAPDVNYVLLSQQGQQGVGFVPGSKLAMQVATGPFSRYLQNPRMARGFGARMMNI
jgi:hypothetical protein